MKMNKSKSIDSLNFISTIANGGQNNLIKNNNHLGKQNSQNLNNNDNNNNKVINDNVNNKTLPAQPASSNQTNQQLHNSIIQITKLNKNQSFESYLIQMHKFFKEKKIYSEPNETYKRRTVVLIRPTSSSYSSSMNSSASSETSFYSYRSNKSASSLPNGNNMSNNNNNQGGEFGFNLQSYGLLNSNTKQTEYICFINNVQPKSVAKKAGLNNGDILLAIDDIKISEFKTFSDIMKHVKGKNELRLVIMTEQLCRKINLQQRSDQIKSLLVEKRSELEKLELKKEFLFKKYNITDNLSSSVIASPVPTTTSNSEPNSIASISPVEPIKEESSTTSSDLATSPSIIATTTTESSSSSMYLSPVSDESNNSIFSSVESTSNSNTSSANITSNINDNSKILMHQNSTPNNNVNNETSLSNCKLTSSLSFGSSPSMLNNNSDYKIIYSNSINNNNEAPIDCCNPSVNKSNETVKSSLPLLSDSSAITNNTSSINSSSSSSSEDQSSSIFKSSNQPVKKSSFIRKYIETATNNLTRSLSSNSMNLISPKSNESSLIRKSNNNNSIHNTPSSANLGRKMTGTNKQEIEENNKNISIIRQPVINDYKLVLNDITTTSSNTDDDIVSIDLNNKNNNLSKSYFRSNSGIKAKNLINLFSLNRSSTSYLSNRTIKSDEIQNTKSSKDNLNNLNNGFSKRKGLFNKLNVSDNNLTYNKNVQTNNSSNNPSKMRMFNILANKPKISNTQKSNFYIKANIDESSFITKIDLNNNNNINNNSQLNNSGNFNASAFINDYSSSTTSSSFMTSPENNSLTSSTSSSTSSSSRTSPSSSIIASVQCNQNQAIKSTPTAKITCPISYYHRSTSFDSNLNQNITDGNKADSNIARVISNGYNFKGNILNNHLDSSLDSFSIPAVIYFSNEDYTITRL